MPDDNYAVTGLPTGFGYLNPATGKAEYGIQAVADAIRNGAISSSNAAGMQNATIGYFDNNASGTPYYSMRRSINLTASGPTAGTQCLLISPTYIGDATLRGSVGLDEIPTARPHLVPRIAVGSAKDAAKGNYPGVPG